MNDQTDILLVYCSCPDAETAGRIATALVEQQLAACVSQVPGLISTYRWEGQMQQDAETLLMIKTRKTTYAELEKTLLRMHPYELPEVIAVPVIAGSKPYLAWINNNTSA
ncbi:MAG: divalent-cation tolerance protein CutA [Gammaproteobacteria bacterium]|nr:divalent-cation tolerance protein CutA [Gammaproteobacteria bacterium]